MAYSAPSTRSTSDLITAAIWNADVVANPIAIYAGAMSVTSQAIGDILYASSTTQFARIAAVATGQVLTSAGTGTVPAYSATPALTSVDMGGTTVYGSRAITVDTGGVLNVVLSSSAGDDFTVDTDKLVVSGDSGAVGVGTAAPVSLLDVRGPTGTGATPAGLLTLATAELTVVDNDQLGRINFQAPLESSGSDAILAVASIYAEATATFSATVNSTDIVFATATDAAVVEHLRLDSRGTMRYGYEGTGKGTFQNESWGTVLGNNTYYTGSAWVAVATGASSDITQDSGGNFVFRHAPSVSAGASTASVQSLTINQAGTTVFNEEGAVRSFRVETDTLANMLSIESSSLSGVGTFGIGVTDAFTNLNSWIGIKGPATTCSANESFNRMRINSGGGAVTIPSGTSSLVTTLKIDEPNITATGTVLAAATLYVGGAPTEGSSNYALWVDAGASRFDGDVGISGSAENELALTTSGGNAVISSRDHMYFNVDSNSDGTAEAFIFGKDRTGTSSGTELMRLKETGYLGLGTDDPQLEMHLETSGDTGIRLVRTGAFTTVGVIAACHSTEQFVIRTETSNGIRFATNTTSGDWTDNTRMVIRGDGDITINNALSKGSGSFRIDHPLPAKTDTHHLVHSFIEGPKCDLIYRGSATLSAGQATVNLDTASAMSEGTWVLLCRDEQCFTSNETGWSSVRGTVSGNILSIECDDTTSVDTISWMVVAERHDTHIMAALWTDNDGRPIVELEKSE